MNNCDNCERKNKLIHWRFDGLTWLMLCIYCKNKHDKKLRKELKDE